MLYFDDTVGTDGDWTDPNNWWTTDGLTTHPSANGGLPASTDEVTLLKGVSSLGADVLVASATFVGGGLTDPSNRLTVNGLFTVDLTSTDAIEYGKVSAMECLVLQCDYVTNNGADLRVDGTITVRGSVNILCSMSTVKANAIVIEDTAAIAQFGDGGTIVALSIISNNDFQGRFNYSFNSASTIRCPEIVFNGAFDGAYVNYSDGYAATIIGNVTINGALTNSSYVIYPYQGNDCNIVGNVTVNGDVTGSTLVVGYSGGYGKIVGNLIVNGNGDEALTSYVFSYGSVVGNVTINGSRITSINYAVVCGNIYCMGDGSDCENMTITGQVFVGPQNTTFTSYNSEVQGGITYLSISNGNLQLSDTQ